MGLCKCPKKKVTNLFCYEHRVNVCEFCLVSHHSRCLVQSYLQWLQDSDYNPDCPLCGKKLSDEETGECVRLVCYDIFHWECLNQHAKRLPLNTAPAGYVCPTCNSCIFPASNVASPVADALREKLSTVNWARAGLGLPLIEEPVIHHREDNSGISKEVTDITPVQTAAQQSLPSFSNTVNHTRPSAQVSPYSTTPSVASGHPQTVINVDSGTTARAVEKDPRKLFDSTDEQDQLLNTSLDHDEDKYKRRSALTWLQRWFNSRESKKKTRDPDATMKKFLIVLVIGIIGFLTIIIIFSRLGRHVTDDDPFLDPMANPNIRVNEQPPKNIPGGKVM